MFPEDDEDDDLSEGAGDGILMPQSVRQNTRTSAGTAADASCAPAAAPEAEAADPDDPMEVNLSQGLDNVHLSSGSRPRGGGGPRRNDPEVEALEGEAGGAWEDEEPADEQGQEAQPPEDDDEGWGEKDEEDEGQEDGGQGEVEEQQPLWKKAPDNLSKASGAQSARSTPSLDDDEDSAGPAEDPQGALKALQGYGNRGGEEEPEAGVDCSGDEDELEGGDRRPRASTPVCPNGPYTPKDEVNRVRPSPVPPLPPLQLPAILSLESPAARFTYS